LDQAAAGISATYDQLQGYLRDFGDPADGAALHANAEIVSRAVDAQLQHLRLRGLDSWSIPAGLLEARTASLAADFEHHLSVMQRAAFVELNAIGGLLGKDPFEGSVTASLRDILGDFRQMDGEVLAALQPAARLEALVAQGFDPALVRFPRARYPTVLDHAGIPRPGGSGAAKGRVSQSESKARAYLLLDFIEGRIRDFLEARLEARFGPNWVEVAVPPRLGRKWHAYRAREREGFRHRVIEYADPGDYAEVICEERNWKEVFEEFFIARESVRESLSRFNLWRRRVAHTRGGWTKAEMLLVRVEGCRLSIAMGFPDELEDVDFISSIA
jgi:hypothetical protein